MYTAHYGVLAVVPNAANAESMRFSVVTNNKEETDPASSLQLIKIYISTNPKIISPVRANVRSTVPVATANGFPAIASRP